MVVDLVEVDYPGSDTPVFQSWTEQHLVQAHDNIVL